MTNKVHLPVISRIVREDGCYTFSITRREECMEYDEAAQAWRSVVKDVTSHYSTGRDGFGLWLGSYPAGDQILGTGQFNLNPSTRRARVKLFALETSDCYYDYERFCSLDAMGQNPSSAELFYSVNS